MAAGRKTGGRSRGTPNKTTLVKQQMLEAAQKAALAGFDPDVIDKFTPLDVMLMAMRAAVRVNDLNAAAVHAKEAAPYVLPRLASTTVTHPDAIDKLGIAELRILLAEAERAAGSAGRKTTIEAGPAFEGKPH